ncbi:MAG: RsmE family RNA methyltransferase [Candidatus Cryptobacteroides sp.]
MELFYAESVAGDVLTLGPEESAHCAKVLRHREGDVIRIADGNGNLHSGRILSLSQKEVTAVSESVIGDWGSHPYVLTMAVCPTKNSDRYEWFIEKAVEMGVDYIVPLIGEHSERCSIRTDRLARIILSAAKQSLKARLPQLSEPLGVKEFIAGGAGCCGGPDGQGTGFIACCFEDGSIPRVSLRDALAERVVFGAPSVPYSDKCPQYSGLSGTLKPRITIMIGPEGDFSPAEVNSAVAAGYVPVHLGPSRLRTETAAVVATAFVYNASL